MSTIAEFVQQMREAKMGLRKLKSEITRAWKDTEQPKAVRPPSAYQRFVSENMAKVRADYPDMGHTERMRELARRWNAHKGEVRSEEVEVTPC